MLKVNFIEEEFNKINGACDDAYVYGFDYQNKIEPQGWQALLARRLSLSWLFLLFINNVNAYEKEHQSKYSKSQTQGQCQFFKEITGESNGKNGFTHITEVFGDKFLGFPMENNHDALLVERCFIDKNNNIKLINNQYLFLSKEKSAL